MKVKISLLIIIFLLSIFTGIVFWVTRGVTLPVQETVVVKEQGLVEVKRAQSEDWVVVNSDTTVSNGDTVRTNEDAEASLYYFDQGTSRLFENTTVVIDGVDFSSDQSVLNGSIELKIGKVWSKLLDFLSPDSIFEVETANTVATVRGTAFLVQAEDEVNEEYVYVDSHQVDVTRKGTAVVGLEEEELIVWNAFGNQVISNVDVLSPEEQEWIQMNSGQDDLFQEKMKNQTMDQLKQIAIDPNSFMYLFVGMSENIRIMLAGEETKGDLEERFFLKRLAEIQMAFINGDEQMAIQLMMELGTMPNNMSEQGEQLVGMMTRSIAQYTNVLSKDAIDAIREFSEYMAAQIEYVVERRSRFDEEEIVDANDQGSGDVIIEEVEQQLPTAEQEQSSPDIEVQPEIESESDDDASQVPIELGEVEDGGYSVQAVEAELGISLPSGSIISTVIENGGYYSTLGSHALSVDDLVSHFRAEFAGIGLSVKRDFGLIPVPNGSSAVFSKAGETWAVFVNDRGNARSFEIVRDIR